MNVKKRATDQTSAVIAFFQGGRVRELAYEKTHITPNTGCCWCATTCSLLCCPSASVAFIRSRLRYSHSSHFRSIARTYTQTQKTVRVYSRSRRGEGRRERAERERGNWCAKRARWRRDLSGRAIDSFSTTTSGTRARFLPRDERLGVWARARVLWLCVCLRARETTISCRDRGFFRASGRLVL